MIDFLKLHYVLSRREGARDPCGYWVDHRRSETIPQRLSDLLALWRHRPPSRYDFNRIQEVFPAASYQYILYGMGFRPEPGLARRMLPALPDNRTLIAHIVRHGLPA